MCFTLDILIVIVFDCGTYERCTGGNGDGDDAKPSKASNNSKVLPIMGDKNRIEAATDRLRVGTTAVNKRETKDETNNKKIQNKHCQ